MVKIKNANIIGEGSECVVYDLDDGTCYKRYHTKENATIAYENALKAEQAGIAPKVYGRDNYGYVTEIVEMYKDDICKHCDTDDVDTCPELCSEFIDAIGRQAYYQLKDTVLKLFDDKALMDLHSGNIGMKNGKPVMIDFGTLSTWAESKVIYTG